MKFKQRFSQLRDATLFGLALFGTGLLALLPAVVVDAGAQWVGRLAYRLSGRRGAQLRANLRVVVGPAPLNRTIESLASEVYANYGRYMVEFFTMHWPDLWGRRKRMVVEEGPLQQAKDLGRGVVLFGIHGGNWDMAASECARRYGAFHSAGESVKPAWLGRLINRVRRGGHTQLYDSMSAARPLLRALRRGEIIGLVADRAVAGPGVEVNLCGRQALVPAGPVWLALKNGAPLLPTMIERKLDGRVHVEFWEAIDLRGLSADDAGIDLGAQRMADALTQMIQRGHASWFALQPVWPDVRP
jgi:lauroyl/myristoyl acyltransferase